MKLTTYLIVWSIAGVFGIASASYAQTPTPTLTPPPPTCTPWVIHPPPPPDCSPSPIGNCTQALPTPEITTSPFPSPIPSPYQLPTGQGVLAHRIYLPPPAVYGSGPYPTIVVIHGGGWHTGWYGEYDVDRVCKDCAAAGYLTISVNYRLAPCGTIGGQTHDDDASGRFPEETDDIKRQILAARDNEHFNGKLGVLGASSGGTHAMWVAFDPTDVGGLGWGTSKQPTAISCLSGIYDMSDQDDASTTAYFKNTVKNYTNTCDRNIQRADSPVALVPSYNGNPARYLYMVQAENDIIPDLEVDDMVCALQTAGISSLTYSYWIIPGAHQHALDLWNNQIKDTPPPYTVLVRDRVLEFFDAHLN